MHKKTGAQIPLVIVIVSVLTGGLIAAQYILHRGEIATLPFRLGGQGGREIIVSARVNGRPVEIEIDTGTDRLLLDENLCSHKDEFAEPLEQIELAIGDWQRTISVGGRFRRGPADPSGLIGTSFLDGARATIDVKEQTITIDRRPDRQPYKPQLPFASIKLKRLGGGMPGLNALLTINGRNSAFFCIDTGSVATYLSDDLYKPFRSMPAGERLATLSSTGLSETGPVEYLDRLPKGLGVVGTNFLYRYRRVTVDYRDRMLFLEGRRP